MKKIISMLLALTMLMTAVCALAEETNLESAQAPEAEAAEPLQEGETEIIKEDQFVLLEDFGVTLPQLPDLPTEMREKAYGEGSTDMVSVNGTMNIVKTQENLVFIMDMPKGYTCLTQDFEASMFGFIRIKDPDALIDSMIEDGIHLLFINDLDNSWMGLSTLGSDAISTRVGNLNTMTKDRITSYAEVFAASESIVFNDLVEAGSTTWMRFNDNILITVAGGQYIMMRSLDKDVPETVLESMTELLSHLIIFA